MAPGLGLGLLVSLKEEKATGGDHAPAGGRHLILAEAWGKGCWWLDSEGHPKAVLPTSLDLGREGEGGEITPLLTCCCPSSEKFLAMGLKALDSSMKKLLL